MKNEEKSWYLKSAPRFIFRLQCISNEYYEVKRIKLIWCLIEIYKNAFKRMMNNIWINPHCLFRQRQFGSLLRRLSERPYYFVLSPKPLECRSITFQLASCKGMLFDIATINILSKKYRLGRKTMFFNGCIDKTIPRVCKNFYVRENNHEKGLAMSVIIFYYNTLRVANN